MEEQEKKRNSELENLLNAGRNLKERIYGFLSSLPSLKDSVDPYAPHKSEAGEKAQKEADELVIESRRWFSSIRQQVLPLVIFDPTALLSAANSVVNGIRGFRQNIISIRHPQGEYFNLDGIKERQQLVTSGIGMAIELVKSVPDTSASTLATSATQPQPTIQPNTAFILMWMDPAKPGLEDIANTLKEIFGQFGIKAVRADDVEHQDKITDVILQHIRESEFLIADLTGERPNVYYEVGYAHAIGKRPILFRKKGTPLHFDLSVHNVPEYDNITALKGLLRKRLEAMTGKNIE